MMTSLQAIVFDFDGVIMSDDMEMGAVRDEFTPEELAVKAVKAGTDIVVFSNVQAEEPQLGVRIHRALVEAVCDGRLSRSRITDAYDRIMRLKQRLERKELAGTW